MRRKIGIVTLILTTLFIGVVFVAGASLISSQETSSNGESYKFNDSNSVRMPLPNFGPQTFFKFYL